MIDSSNLIAIGVSEWLQPIGGQSVTFFLDGQLIATGQTLDVQLRNDGRMSLFESCDEPQPLPSFCFTCTQWIA